MKTTELITTMRQHKNPEKIPAMEQYMRNQFQFLGIQAVQRRELAKEFLKTKRTEAKAHFQNETHEGSAIDWEMVFDLFELPEREFQLVGLDYLKRVQKYFIQSDLKNLRTLVLTKSWWDSVDTLAKLIGSLVLKENLQETMRTWSLTDNIWLRRVSILHQLSFKQKTDTALLQEVIGHNLQEDEFFIQKAIGWALRDYAKTDAAWVKEFVTSFHDELSALSIREAMKNIND